MPGPGQTLREHFHAARAVIALGRGEEPGASDGSFRYPLISQTGAEFADWLSSWNICAPPDPGQPPFRGGA